VEQRDLCSPEKGVEIRRVLGYEAKALDYSIFTEAETMEELKKNIVEAVNTHFDEVAKPLIIRLHYVKEELLSA
ncbi:MAG: hypothetical protein ACP5US_12070, partial [Candidatus Kryptoniota bacterium]